MPENFKYDIKEDGRVVVTIDCSEEAIKNTTNFSKKGNKLVASSGGWMMLPVKLKKGSVAISFNVVYK